jgi:hypothetical protein
MNPECKIKDYLKNRIQYQKTVIEDIKFIHEELSRFSELNYPEIKDAVLSCKQIIKPTKNNEIRDQTAMAFFRYQELTKNYLEKQNEIINAKLDHLDYLNDLKCFYDSIDLQIIKLDPKNKISVDIFIKGGKIGQIAQELDCSYNSARLILNASIKSIIQGIDSELLREICNYS